MPQTCYIYTLHASNDPECRPRYVGFTINPKNREKQSNGRRETGRKRNWIQNLRLQKCKVVLAVIYTFRSDDVVERGIIEDSWIELYQKKFPDLLNDLGGGQGVRKWPDGLRKKQSEAMKRRYTDESEREKAGNIFRKYWANPEAREKQKEAQKRRNADPAEREKRRVGQIRRFTNPEERKKNSENVKRAYANPFIRKKHLLAMSDPEVRKKLSENTKKLFANPAARKRAAENAKRSWQNPEYRAKRKATFENKRWKKILDAY